MGALTLHSSPPEAIGTSFIFHTKAPRRYQGNCDFVQAGQQRCRFILTALLLKAIARQVAELFP